MPSIKLLIIALALFLLSFSSVNAAIYQTPLFSTNSHNFQSLSYIFATSTPIDTTIEFQTKSTHQDADNWQPLSPDSCITQKDNFLCSVPFPQNYQTLLQFRLTYPNDTTLKSFNLSLTPIAPPETPPDITEPVFYSSFKTIDQNKNATQISWRETALTTPATDQIILQTRSSSDNLSWTPWTGNATITKITDFNLDHNSLTLTSPTATTSALLAISYLSPHPASLAQPAATGANEASAFANKTFYLTSTDQLYLGETITLVQEIGDTTHRLTGIISDLKPSENLVSVFNWQGTIPHQDPSLCGHGNNICFSSTTQLITTQELFVPFTKDEAITLPPNINSADILELSLLSYLPPICLEPDETAPNLCLTQSLDLTSLHQNTSPQSLQYRIIYGQTKDKLISDIFLHQDNLSSSTTSNTFNYLRGGKTLNAGVITARPYYWH